MLEKLEQAVGTAVALLGLSMPTIDATNSPATATIAPVANPLAADLTAATAAVNALRRDKRIISTGSAKSQFDSAVSLLELIGENEAALYWQGERNRVLSAFGSVRTKSADGEATKGGVDFGSASLAKVLKHLSTPKREGALLSAAWAMAHAIALR